MGNKQSSSQITQFHDHQRLGPTRFFEVSEKNQDDQMERIPKMQITSQLQSMAQYTQWENNLRKINDSQGLELFLIPEKFVFEKAGMCGNSGFAQLAFNKFEFVLSSEIKNRKNLNKFFEQTEIWYVLYNLVRAGNKFQILKQKIGDIHPNNILINQDGQTAIISQYSIPNQEDNFQKYLSNQQKQQVFLAPEQIAQEDLQKGVYNSKNDKCLAQVFSLGMTLLSTGTLQHCNDVYLRDPLRIDSKRLKVLLEQFSIRYSQYLTQTLKSMLEFDPTQRIRSQKLYSILSQYENKILDLQPFNVQVQQNHPQSYYTPYQQNNGYYNQPYGNNTVFTHYSGLNQNQNMGPQVRINEQVPNYVRKN